MGSLVIAFYKPDWLYGPFSNWWMGKFMCGDKLMISAEQALMYRKALLFNDFFMANKIMNMKDNAQIKKAGRNVVGFNQEVWDGAKFDIMCDILKYKFRSEEMASTLLGTGCAVLAEASPTDKVWGTGLNIKQTMETPESQWPGENLLGKALMNTRSWLYYWQINNGQLKIN